MTDLDQTTSIDPLPVAETQRRMLVGFGAALLTMTSLQIVFPAIQYAGLEDGESVVSVGTIGVVLYLVQIVALAAFLVPAFRLIPLIGWSTANQLAFVLVCLLSFGCSPLLLLAMFLINQQANRILRDHDLRVGFLGVPRSEIDRLRKAGDAPQG